MPVVKRISGNFFGVRHGPGAFWLAPVPGSTAASAVLIGALADEPPLNNNDTPGESPGATREGVCGPRDGQSHQLGRPSYSRRSPANAWVQGLWATCSCAANQLE
jgi:hypothetical protein